MHFLQNIYIIEDMISLSLCMIVKNEESVLNRCLSSVENLFDEIIIVDTGSTDKTKSIAKKYTNKIYDFVWCDDFSKARNFSLSMATSDFVMWLDADDVITTENLQKLFLLKQKLSLKTDIVMLKYALSFVDNKPTFSFYRERIFNRRRNFKFCDAVHEFVVPFGNIIYEDIVIEHRKIKATNPKRNIKIYEKMQKNGEKFTPRNLYYYARELYYNNKYSKAITYFKKFLNEKETFLENKIEACLTMSKCYQMKNDLNNAMRYLFLSFSFDLPRAEICCELAYIFQAQKKFNLSNYWFEKATKILPNFQSGGFILNECYDFIPYLEMCVNYYNLGNIEKSFYYNTLAKGIKPSDKVVLNNEKILLNLINKKTAK